MSATSKISLTTFFNSYKEQSLPFAFYQLPNSSTIKIVAQKNSLLRKIKKGENYTQDKGYLFAPFVENRNVFKTIIRADIFCEEKEIALHFPLSGSRGEDPASTVRSSHTHKKLPGPKSSFQSLVRKIKEEIVDGQFSKVVAACILEKEKPKDFDPTNFFRALCKKYPTAFVSLVYTPQFGLWIGASPEILLQHDGASFKTYSLAGTKANTTANRKNAFGEKEKEEQKIVSDYISKCLQKTVSAKQIANRAEVVEAGNLLHLRTTFSFSSTKNKWQKIAEKLHPTPAVAGFPKKKAIDFILKNETTSRNFYSGYLGPINLDKQINLFVNLRCMQVMDDTLKLHVGCGITASSNPMEEWKEVEIKAQTLLSAL